MLNAALTSEDSLDGGAQLNDRPRTDDFYQTFDPSDAEANEAQAVEAVIALNSATVEFTDAVVRYIQTKCLAITAIASVGLLIQSSHDCSRSLDCTNAFDGKLAYSVSVSVVSLLVCIVWFVGTKYRMYDFQPFMVPCTMFLSIWWLIAAWVLTFDAPYTFTGNGYFSTWAATVSSVLFAQQSSPMVRRLSWSILGQVSGQQSSWLLLASLVELLAASHACSRSFPNGCNDELGWAVAVGAISSTVCLILIGTSASFVMPTKLLCNVGMFLVALWIPGVYVLTFREPFSTFGNGYFASWSALFLSIYFTGTVWNKESAREGTFAGREDSTMSHPEGPLSEPYVIATNNGPMPVTSLSSPSDATPRDSGGMIDQGEDYATI
jgi:hypothetical protein